MGLFDRPAWAQDTTADSDGEVEEVGDIFRHSDRSYKKIVEDQERQRQQRLQRHDAKTEKCKVNKERKSSGKHKSNSDSEDDFDHKKRRFNAGDGAALLSDIGLFAFAGGKAGDDSSDEQATSAHGKGAVRRSPRSQRVGNRSDKSRGLDQRKQAPVIDLGDSDDDGGGIVGSPVQAAPPAPAEPEDDESDEEFAALARQARERYRQQQQLGAATSANPDAGAAQSPVAGEPPPDPVIQILITSKLPNTNPLIVHRRFSQRLKEIRTVWCQKQGFSDEFTKDVFLTFRMRRLWDVTTCKSLGLDINENGEVFLKGSEEKEGVDKVHLEAMTDDTLAQAMAEEARRKQANDQGELDEQAEAGAAGPTKPVEEKKYVRIILKAKGKDDFKLKVKDSTIVSKIVAACGNNWQLDDMSNVWLEFDGEKLEASEQISNTEISDLDMIDVHIP